MNRNVTDKLVQEIMLDFARLTGLVPADSHPRRYLWTDAFAVCNYLELFRRTNDKTYRDLSLYLVDQVHHTLGRHRDDDPRRGWISGLDEQEGVLHPTIRGLRIGKKLNEHRPEEPPNERLEWDQDGQYYHYLTKWMHALNCVSRVIGDPTYMRWAIELAQTAHTRFTYAPPTADQMRMYWKMSIDLTYPLDPSMGQHDPLDGFVTYSELQATAEGLGESPPFDLKPEIADMAKICRGIHLTTDDPLGIGGLLFDASRIAQLMIKGRLENRGLLESIVDSAMLGIESFAKSGLMEYPAEYRLAFRELGLSIGLSAIENLQKGIEENPGVFSRESRLHRLAAEDLMGYLPLRKTIEQFWMDDKNRQAGAWIEHREINMVMLATSLAPDEFLMI